ncbi:MAG: ribose-5-phosphate isomerase RpiA [Chloroflexota bacterium]|nr:ribose-5-phosphate isomerase RpiA [Chloroflexota bacterium]
MVGEDRADPLDQQRRAAAQQAVTWVRDGMVLGFGTGRAAGHALEAIAHRRRTEGLRISGVPSSRATEERARALELPLTTLEAHPELDLTIDGADEVNPARHMLKGAGGALLREKVLAAASHRLLIVVERVKLVPHLGATRGVPLEVLPFAAPACLLQLRALGGTPLLRHGADGSPAVNDNGHWVVDCDFERGLFADLPALDQRLRSVPGILETGLFWSFQPVVFVGGPEGVETLGA